MEQFISKVALLGQWGYLIIFLSAFLESSAFVGLIIPGETIVVISGFLAYHGYLNIWDCVLIAAAGAVMGDSVGYALGGHIGKGYFKTHKSLFVIKDYHIEKTYGYFRKHGPSTVFFGRYISFFRLFVPFVAGMSEMPYGRFLLYNAAGGITWAFLFTLLGYFFGESWQLAEVWAGRAGGFMVFILAIAAVFIYAYARIVKNKARLYAWFRAKYDSANSHPYVTGFKRRHPRAVSFLVNRLSPGSYLGLHLTVGLTLSSALILLFGLLLTSVFSSYPLAGTNPWLAARIQHFEIPAVTAFMKSVAYLSGRKAILGASLLIMPFLLGRKRYDYIAGYLASVIGGMVLIVTINSAVNWILPAARLKTLWNSSWSFPGEHAVMSTVFFGILCYFIIRGVRSWRVRVMTGTVAAFLVLLTGMSSVYLRLGHISEILAGYVGGLFWLSICVTGLSVYRRKAESRRRSGH